MNHLAFGLNEIVSKFLSRNPTFDGGISLIGTSFAALFLFDLLQFQKSSPEFWKLNFTAFSFYSFGMPSSLLTIRNGHSNIDTDCLCKFINVIHSMDPIAQRSEPIVKPELSQLAAESIDNEGTGRIDFIIEDTSEFDGKNYFNSESLILRIVREINGKKLELSNF